MKRLRRYELKPFAAAIEARVKMIMLGHLSVPALDASGIPGLLFEEGRCSFFAGHGYDGLLITDALNMGASANITRKRHHSGHSRQESIYCFIPRMRKSVRRILEDETKL